MEINSEGFPRLLRALPFCCVIILVVVKQRQNITIQTSTEYFNLFQKFKSLVLFPFLTPSLKGEWAFVKFGFEHGKTLVCNNPPNLLFLASTLHQPSLVLLLGDDCVAKKTHTQILEQLYVQYLLFNVLQCNYLFVSSTSFCAEQLKSLITDCSSQSPQFAPEEVVSLTQLIMCCLSGEAYANFTCIYWFPSMEASTPRSG